MFNVIASMYSTQEQILIVRGALWIASTNENCKSSSDYTYLFRRSDE